MKCEKEKIVNIKEMLFWSLKEFVANNWNKWLLELLEAVNISPESPLY